MKRVVVVGGGIGGLTTALHFRDRAERVSGGLEITVLEGSDRVGGNIRTHREDGFTVEWGPNGYLDNAPATPALVERLELTDQVQPADERAARRFLYRNGRLHLLPLKPGAFFRSPVLSLRGRLRILGEPFARSRPDGVDETVEAFASRRIGPEAANVLVDAMVSGVFAGNVHRLSLKSAFPKMAAMEAQHGSLVKAMMAAGKARRRARREGRVAQGGGPAGPGGTLTSFRNGLDTFVFQLAGALGESLRLSRRLEGMELHSENGAAPTWRLRTTDGETFEADAVVLGLPGRFAGPVLSPLDATLGEKVSAIATASVAVVALGFDADAMGGPPDGFGFLVPRGQGPRILGCLWDSSIFPGRAPEGKVLLRAMIGGAHDPEAVGLSDDRLLDLVRRDLQTTMGLTAEPSHVWIFRHPLGIAQYNVGHQALLDGIHQRLASLPGLWVTGSSYYGISMNACIEKAGPQADEVLEFLGSSVGS